MYSYCKWQYTKGLLVILYSREMEVFFLAVGVEGMWGGNQSETIQIVLSRLYYRTFKKSRMGEKFKNATRNYVSRKNPRKSAALIKSRQYNLYNPYNPNQTFKASNFFLSKVMIQY